MKISIITVSFNSGKTIERTIKSVLSQTYSNIEYIIIDGGSVDNTPEIVERYKDKIHKFISEKDNGIYDAMNKGISIASGDVVGILNSDDIFANNDVLLNISKAFESETIDAVYGDITYFNSDPKQITRYWKSGEYKESKLDNGWIIPHPGFFVRKEIYNKYGNFNTSFKIAGDYELIFRLLKIYKIKTKYIPLVFVNMYNGGVSGQSLSQRMKGWEEIKKAWILNNLKLPNFFIIRRIVYKLSQFIKC